MKKHLLRNLVMLAAVGMCSCVADVDVAKMDPSVKLGFGAAMPLGEMSVSIGDFLGGMQESAGDMMYVNEDGVLCIRIDSIHVEEELDSLDLTDGMEPVKMDLMLGDKLPAELATGFIMGDGSPKELKFDIAMGLGDINKAGSKNRIDSAMISQLQFAVKLDCKDFTMSFDKIDRVDLVLAKEMHAADTIISLNLDGKGFGKVIPVEINDFVLDLMKDHDAAPGKNNVTDSLKMKLIIVLALETDEKIFISHTSAFGLEFGISKLDYKAVFGYFEPDGLGDETMSIDLSEMLPIWEQFGSFRVPFANPVIDLAVTTNIGAPLNLHINYFKAIDKNKTDVAYALFNGSRQTDIELENKVQMTDPLETKVTNEIQFSNDPAKGHIDTLFSVEPEKLEFSYSASILQKSDYPQFRIPKKAGVSVDGSMTLPMEFKEGLNLEMSDTLPISLSAMDMDSLTANVNMIDSLSVQRLKLGFGVKNGLPFAVKVKMKGLDKDGNPVDLGVESLKEFSIAALKETQITADLNKAQADLLTKIENIVFTFALQDDKSADLTYPVALNMSSQLAFKVAVGVNLDAYLKLDFSNKQ